MRQFGLAKRSKKHAFISDSEFKLGLSVSDIHFSHFLRNPKKKRLKTISLCHKLKYLILFLPF